MTTKMKLLLAAAAIGGAVLYIRHRKPTSGPLAAVADRAQSLYGALFAPSKLPAGGMPHGTSDTEGDFYEPAVFTPTPEAPDHYGDAAIAGLSPNSPYAIG